MNYFESYRRCYSQPPFKCKINLKCLHLLKLYLHAKGLCKKSNSSCLSCTEAAGAELIVGDSSKRCCCCCCCSCCRCRLELALVVFPETWQKKRASSRAKQERCLFRDLRHTQDSEWGKKGKTIQNQEMSGLRAIFEKKYGPEENYEGWRDYG